MVTILRFICHLLARSFLKPGVAVGLVRHRLWMPQEPEVEVEELVVLVLLALGQLVAMEGTQLSRVQRKGIALGVEVGKVAIEPLDQAVVEQNQLLAMQSLVVVEVLEVSTVTTLA